MRAAIPSQLPSSPTDQAAALNQQAAALCDLLCQHSGKGNLLCTSHYSTAGDVYGTNMA